MLAGVKASSLTKLLLGGSLRFVTILLVYLTVVFYLLAWAGSVVFQNSPQPLSAAAMWNKVFAVFCLISGILAAFCLLAAIIGRPVTN